MHRDRKYVHFAYLVIDTLLIGLSFYVPYCLRYNRSIIPFNLPYFRDYCLLFFLWGVSLVFFLNNYRLYSTDHALTIPKETWIVVRCVFFASVLAYNTTIKANRLKVNMQKANTDECHNPSRSPF